MHRVRQLRHVHRAYRDGLMARSDVIGVAVGFRKRNGHHTGEHVVKIYVARKLPNGELRPGQRLPSTLHFDGVEAAVDVEELEAPPVPPMADQITVPRPADPHLVAERRPLAGGFSLSHYEFQVGTVAIGVLDRSEGYHCVLSCNHVLARMNHGQRGDAALQPALADGGVYPFQAVGALLRYVPVRFDGTPNRVDAAIAACAWGDVSNQVHGIGAITESAEPATVMPGDTVTKVGRTTGRTQGTVLVTDMAVKANYKALGFQDQLVPFVDQIVVGIPAGFGDSGSLLLDSANRAIGMLFGGIHHSWFNPFTAIERELNICLLPSHV